MDPYLGGLGGCSGGQGEKQEALHRANDHDYISLKLVRERLSLHPTPSFAQLFSALCANGDAHHPSREPRFGLRKLQGPWDVEAGKRLPEPRGGAGTTTS